MALNGQKLPRQTATKTLPQYASASAVSQRPINPIARLLKMANTKPRHLIVAVLASVAAGFLELLPMLLFGLVVQTATLGRSSFLARLGVVGLRSQLLLIGLALALTFGLAELLDYVQRKKWRHLSRVIEHNMRVDILAHVQHLDLAYLDSQSSDKLAHVIYDDTGLVDRFLEFGINDLIRATVLLVTIGIVFLILSPLLAGFAVLIQPLLIWFVRTSQKRLAPRYRELDEETNRFHHLLANNLAGLPTVKSFTAEDFEIERTVKASEAVRQTNVRAADASSADTSLIRGLFSGSLSAILTLTGLLVVSGAMPLSVFLVIIPFIGIILLQMRNMDQNYDLYKRATSAAERILQVLETPVSIRSGPHRLPLDQVHGTISFDQLGFQYAPSVEVLDGFSLHIHAQEHVALVGATGSGKTTLVKLLLRFYDVTAGAIQIDGVDIRELSLHDLRTCIGLISQDVYLFDGTVSDNIVYGRRDASFDEVVMAARVAEAHDFIERLPQGYQTMVGERGQRLSGGQRQRVAIARAVLKNAPILILDEATSSLDNETETAIQRSLDRLATHRTTITIAHRLSTVRNADRIYVIDGGQICEEGDHDELLSLDGVYAALWRMQTGDAIG
ncbi:ABC transporter ATP-binding protein [Candidatus Entotheonella palauensis]|nr:ABC transporter ATP-binding protein [Candidatus Entotheonella palauensis]